MPSVLPRVVIIPSEKKGHTTVTLLEQIIERNIDKLFLSYDVICAHPYRIMRNADLPIDEDEAEDLLVEIQKQLKKRQWGEVIRLEVEDKMDPRLLDILKMEFQVHGDDIFFINGPLDLTMLMKVYGIDGYDQFKEPKYKPAAVPAFQNDKDIFQVIREGDVFLHHPYMSFDPVVNFVRQAAKDPDVLAIKQTLYRVSGNSPIIAALAQAAENGKQVSVLVELKARFDEENNIGWSKLLEESGCHVMYGPQGLKVHSKLCLITRKVGDSVKYTVQVGTGNYNEKTAGLYTDLCLMTSNNDIAQDACEVFRTLSMGELVESSKALMVAPHCLQNKVVELMDNEISIARAGGEGYVAAKLNSLTDKVLMDKIIECSQAGVKVELVIRGISCLVAGVEGVTDNVQIRSIVGRYLEHARIYIFGTGVRKKVYISSADYMTRNTTRRVEVAAPILSEEVKKRVLDIFDTQMQDNVKARIMQPDGKYVRAERGDIAIDAQSRFYAEAYANAPKPAPVNDSKAVEPEKEKKGFLGWLKRLFRRKKK